MRLHWQVQASDGRRKYTGATVKWMKQYHWLASRNLTINWSSSGTGDETPLAVKLTEQCYDFVNRRGDAPSTCEDRSTTMNEAGFFIVGAPRTGSTLLRRILNAHSRVAIPPESPFLIDYLLAERVPAATRLRLLLDDPEYAQWRQGLLREFRATDVAGAIVELHAAYAASAGKSRWGQKTPRLVRVWETVATRLPTSRFVHTVRDPRAVAASLRKSAAHRNHALAAARRWRLDAGHGLAMERALPGRVLRVAYESLARDPETEVRRLCEFLDLPFEPEMLRPGRELTLNPHEDRHGHHRRVAEPISTESVDAWRDELSPRDLAAVHAVCADPGRSLGYELAPAAPPSRLARWGYACDGAATAIFKLMRDLRQRRPFWRLWTRRWRLGTFWSQAKDYFAGR